jgi:hypothetical protein
MRRLIAMLLLAAGPATAQAPLIFAPICEGGRMVGLRIGFMTEIPAGIEAVVRWEPDLCKGRDA